MDAYVCLSKSKSSTSIDKFKFMDMKCVEFDWNKKRSRLLFVSSVCPNWHTTSIKQTQWSGGQYHLVLPDSTISHFEQTFQYIQFSSADVWHNVLYYFWTDQVECFTRWRSLVAIANEIYILICKINYKMPKNQQSNKDENHPKSFFFRKFFF